MLDNPVLQSKYRIHPKPIGGGSFSVVYRAVEVATERPVAIKALRREAYRQTSEEYAQGELSALGRIWGHPNIVSVHTVEPGDEEYIAYVVTEYVGGTNLRTALQKGPLPVDRAYALAFDLCSGLAHAHRQNVVHRDLKPSNILLTPQGIAKISDFGVAHVRELVHDFASTFAGTRRYMAPEQYDGIYDHRVDIFALGTILWEAVVGRFPYDGQTPEEIRRQKRAAAPEPPETLPDPMREILHRCLQPNPVHRFRNVEEIQQILEETLIGQYEAILTDFWDRDLSPDQLGPALQTHQQILRISPRVARLVERCSQYRREMEDQAAQRREAEQHIVECVEALHAHVARRNRGSAELALRRLRQIGQVPDALIDLVETLVHSALREPQGTGGTAGAPLTPSRRTSSQQQHPDEETTALQLIEQGKYYERRNRWRKARNAFRASGDLYAHRARAAREAGELQRAARLFQKAGLAYQYADDKKSASAAYRQAAEVATTLAATYRETGVLELAAEQLRTAARAYEQSQEPKVAQQHYQQAATTYLEAAQQALAQKNYAAATRLCKTAAELVQSAQGWNLLDAVRQLQAEIYRAQHPIA